VVPTGRLVRLHTALHPEAPETGAFCSILWVVGIITLLRAPTSRQGEQERT
jgi:hypothetical protein